MSQRNKGKSGGMAYPGDFIALGSKSSSSSGVSKRDVSSTSVSSLGSSSLVSSSGLGVSTTSCPNSASTTSTSTSSSSKKRKRNEEVALVESWESKAVELGPETDVMTAILDAAEDEDTERVVGCLCGAVKILRSSRAKPDMALCLSLLLLAKSDPFLFFGSEFVFNAFASLLKRDIRESYKAKGNPVVPLLAANILMASFAEEKNWPEVFVSVYIDDALGERIWVDHPDAKGFVDNVLTAFNTKLSNPLISGTPLLGSASGSGSATPTRNDEDSSVGTALNLELVNPEYNHGLSDCCLTFPRYGGQSDVIESLVMEIVREQLNRRTDVTKNFLKFLTSAAGVSEVRLLSLSKIEVWIMNQKIHRSAQELLLAISVNCRTHSPSDIEVIGHFTKLRFKSKQNLNLFLVAIRELCNAHPQNLPRLIKHTLFNELSNSRNSNNMSVLSVIFTTDGERAASSLAEVFLELLIHKDCYLRALRLLLREIVRALKHDINLPYFVTHLLSGQESIEDFENKERLFKSITDLIVLSIFLGISPSVRESLSAYYRGEKKDVIPFKNYLNDVSLIQNEAVTWLHDTVPKVFKPEPPVFLQSLYKVFFMLNCVSIDEYVRIDGWPPENERNLYFKATTEVPVIQNTLMIIFKIGLTKNLPLNVLDTVHLVEDLIKRAAGLSTLHSDLHSFSIQQPEELITSLFQLAAYNYPESITLPFDYVPPSLAISTAYWKVWTILVLCAANSPARIGQLAWENYPSLRAFMEMCITNQFLFPPPTIATGDFAEELKNKELVIHEMEKHAILEFENHLAKPQVISESNSILLPQLITMDPTGELRRPPEHVLETLKKLNAQYKIGHYLCRSRKPDFLLEILQRQGSSQTMPWLADLVESSEGSFHLLPVQCLCEFLLNGTQSEKTSESLSERLDTRKVSRECLQKHLMSLLFSPSSDPNQCFEILDYFLRRLSSSQTCARAQALSGLRLVLYSESQGNGSGSGNKESDGTTIQSGITCKKTPCSSDNDEDWLLVHLPSLPSFPSFNSHISQQLRAACGCENDAKTVSLYLRFLVQFAPTENLEALGDLCLDLASIIVERSTLFPALLPNSSSSSMRSFETYTALLRLFYHYMVQLKRETVSHIEDTSSSQDYLRLFWPRTTESATVHIFVVHAQIILLTYGPSPQKEFESLMNLWFSPELPQGFLLHTSEEVLMIPDWLKLRMIRSNIPALVNSALNDLLPSQLVLFIQSFGIPVNSMSKLLRALDEAVIADVEAVREAVMDRTYMGQLVAVQHQRGAEGGASFASALALENICFSKEKEKTEKMEISETADCESESEKLLRAPTPLFSSLSLSSSNVQNNLYALFDIEVPPTKSRLSLKEKHSVCRSLQKSISCSFSTLAVAVRTLHFLLTSPQGKTFVDSLTNHYIVFFSSLFRLITLKALRLLNTGDKGNKENEDKKRQNNEVSEILLLVLKDLSSLMMSNKSKTLNSLVKHYMLIYGDNSIQDVSETSLSKDFELVTFKLVSRGLASKDLSGLIPSLTQYLLTHSEMGLLTDWLPILDSEYSVMSTHLQISLLFSKSSFPCKPYLLSILIHESNWSSLRATIAFLLESYDSQYDSLTVLDFLSACLSIPVLLRGKDKYVSKHEELVNVLRVKTSKELNSLLDYILFEEPTRFSKRLPLLLPSLSSDESLRVAMDYLSKEISTDSMSLTSKKKSLMYQIYLQIPKIVFLVKGCLIEEPTLENLKENTSSCILDTLSHSLLSALSSTQPGRQWASQMCDFESAARKLASSHPYLLLRNLKLLSSSLKGRTVFDFSVFRSRNHYKLYFVALGLLELLVPFVFRSEFEKALQETCTSYFELIKAYESRKESLLGLLDKYFQFLLLYVSTVPLVAIPFLRRVGKDLPALQRKMPHCASLQKLVESFSWNENEHNRLNISSFLLCVSTFEIEKFVNRFIDIESSSAPLSRSEDLLSILSDLIAVSSNKPEMLYPFLFEYISLYMTHPVKAIRNHAFTLYVRLLHQSPKVSTDVISSYFHCLESKDFHTVLSACEKLSAVCVYAQESVGSLCETVFSLGLHRNINVLPYLTETISLLNSHMGY